MSTICLNKAQTQWPKILLNLALSHHSYDSVPSQKGSSLSKSIVLKRINIGKLPNTFNYFTNTENVLNFFS